MWVAASILVLSIKVSRYIFRSCGFTMQFIIIVWTSPYYSIMALINIWGRHSDLSTWKRFFSRRTIWMSSSDEGHNCFNFFFHNSNAYEATHFLDKINCPRAKISYLLVSYRSMSRTAKNITSLTITSTFILYFAWISPLGPHVDVADETHSCLPCREKSGMFGG